MCGYVIRGSVAAYYAKYYLNGGDSLISPLPDYRRRCLYFSDDRYHR